jgi:hypothetical protein
MHSRSETAAMARWLRVSSCLVLLTMLLPGCGGGGGNPGTCHGSAEVCSASGDSTGSGTTAGSIAQLFSSSGIGDRVLALPSNVTRVRIQASFSGTAQNFVVKANGNPLVNAVVGTSVNPSTFDATFSVQGGSTVEIAGSDGVSWSVEQVQ